MYDNSSIRFGSGEKEISPYSHSILLTEAPLNTKVNSENMMIIMLETLSVPAMYVQP